MLRGFLPSILNQRGVDFEIVISDNCSTDDTADVIAACADPRIRYYRNETNIGPFPNMNRLLTLARGEYVCIVHDDDVYDPDFLRRESEMLDRHPLVGMVHCAVREVESDGTPRRVVRAYPTTRVLEGRREFVRYLEGHNVCCSSVMARRAVYDVAGPFDGRFLCADFLMWLKCALAGDVAYIADPLVDMRVHHDSVTSWLDPARWQEEFVAILEEGFALGVMRQPELAALRAEVFRRAAYAQGHRFLVAALAAVSRGEFDLAAGYTAVLDRFQGMGLPRYYGMTARLLANDAGRRLLTAVARVRRARARKLADAIDPAMRT
jgi:glycosyltransferase involved in cell wall biosynthesis